MSLLSRIDRDRLAAAMLDVFDLAALQRFTLVKLGISLEKISLAQRLDNLVIAVIDWSARKGKELLLLNELKATCTESAPMQAVLADIAVSPANSMYNGVSPFEAHWLRDGTPFANRATVRQALRKLADPQGCRIVVVDGPEGSGRSYAFNFIEWLAAQLDSFAYAFIDLADEGSAKEPADIVRAIRAQLEVEIRPLEEDRRARWISELAESMIAGMARKSEEIERRIWLVFDGFNRKDQSPETLDLIKELAKRVSKFTPRVRLVLLGYGEPVHEDISLTTKLARIEPLSRKDLVDYFLHLQGYLGAVAAGGDVLADQIIAKVAGLSEPQRGKVIRVALVSATEQILEAATPA